MEQTNQSRGTGSQVPPPADARPCRTHSAMQDPKDYAKRIDDYANLTAGISLHAGGHFQNLASYLKEAFKPKPPTVMSGNTNEAAGGAFKFVSIYELDPSKERKPRHIDSISDFEEESKVLLESSAYGHLVFMRGHPSPEWLTSIGARYQIDPEFFQRHLDFRLGRPDYFPLPSLPSTSSSMIKLRITTLGCSQNSLSSVGSQRDLEALQERNSEIKAKYREKLWNHSSFKLGDSIVRDCSVHDLSHFSLEQDVSIHIFKTKRAWAGLIWLDHGSDLSAGPASALSSPIPHAASWRTKYLPVIQHKPRVALKSVAKLLARQNTTGRAQSGILQSPSLLHLDYGRSLDRHNLAHDPFYAVHELFTFAAFSEVQFLNMLESKLKQELDHSVLVRQKDPTLSNLLYNQQVLDRHIERIRENLSTIRERSLSQLLIGDHEQEQQKEAEAAANLILQDYQYLLDRSVGLSKQCNRGMQVVMNNAMIKESREAMSQAAGVAKLTRLAFIFVPLSFTTSFFGMNFVQFGTGSLTIWVWFVVSFPIFTLSLALMRYDMSELVRKNTQRKYDKTATC